MFIEAKEAAIFYEVVGAGPPLLIPGWASQPRWATLANHFSDEYTVIGCDVRGAGGKTTALPGPYSVDDMAEDLALVIETLGVATVHYLGFSHTGLLGQVLALRHPEMIGHLVLTMTTPGGDTVDPSASPGHLDRDRGRPLMAAGLQLGFINLRCRSAFVPSVSCPTGAAGGCRIRSARTTMVLCRAAVW